jgi:hypothetical protein
MDEIVWEALKEVGLVDTAFPMATDTEPALGNGIDCVFLTAFRTPFAVRCQQI